jgi:hypothetical protein
MGLIIGPTPWWQANLVSACPAGTTLPDGSRIISKAGGTAYIVAPSCTEVGQTWNNSTDTLVGNKPLACDWPTLCTRLIQCGFNYCDWCVPSSSVLLTFGYACRTNWDTFSSTIYWTSTENNSTSANIVNFITGGPGSNSKTGTFCVRAFRTVTY